MSILERIQGWFRKRSRGVNDPYVAELLPHTRRHPEADPESLDVLWRWVAAEAQQPQKEYDEGMPLFVLQGPTVSGFILGAGEVLPPAFLLSVFEWLKHRLPDLGYQITHADRRYYRDDAGIRMVERVALRPAVLRQMRQGDYPLDQRYGSVMLELTYHHNLPGRLRLTVKPMHDRRYSTARPFPELLAQLRTLNSA